MKSLKSLSLEEIEYEIRETPYGTFRRFVYENGTSFEEYTSHYHIGSLPFYHRTKGKCPETGRRK
ncbi:MAG: hypothetical protein KDA78_09490, partial [Planctomycetaceae bacterium]|nr:hypothetical protein [Planctomycetaceae bacterium]